MADSISKKERSALMAKVRSKGNRSTEGKVEAALKSARIKGWKKHPKDVPGCPDFYFPKSRLAVFVDGCFWHACPKCGRLPSSNAEYWTPKGTVKFSGSVADLADETRHAELPWISIPTRHYQPRRLAVSPLRCELSRCRRSPGPTRHYGVLRSDPAVVPHVRFSIRSPAQASTGPAGRHLAPGRGLRHHPGTAALSLACRRSRW